MSAEDKEVLDQISDDWPDDYHKVARVVRKEVSAWMHQNSPVIEEDIEKLMVAVDIQ